ncbi:galactoside O-acetyltransferase [Clostridium zeae]|uniref:Chloramphenicol acetyltransferase n=1 Tax=Clostridium zeae TaxID=2759022 RepID=A0ABQ1EGK1_9CLOT|nr:acyltransferase [Clostridium zeae]GFZ33962.1 galactoside O-acetyltransferase [Clostridium zeae]
MNSFYSKEELNGIGFSRIGNNVLISRKCSIYSPEKISIGDNVRIDDFSILTGNISIGNYVHIASYVALYAGREGIEVEDFVGISARSLIYSVTDDYSGEYLTNPTIPMQFKNIQDEKVILRKHSLVGAGCIVLPGVVIEEGCSFGAMSLINKSTQPWGVYIGAPAKRLKDRSKNLLKVEKQFLD